MNERPYWAGKRIFVTGATGIVGSRLTADLVSHGAYVVALVRDADPQTEFFRGGTSERVSIVSGRLEDYDALERAINDHEIDTVFHLGAQAIVGTALRSPLPTFEANIRGTYNLLEACRRLDMLVKRVVVASSDKAYGEVAQLPYVEDMPAQGKHPYDVSKSCTDLLTSTYAHTYGLPAVIARCGNIFGGGDLNWSRIVPGTIRSLLRGEQPIIRSNGEFVRDYIYVADVVDAYLRLGESIESRDLAGEAFNFSLETPVSVLELVDRIRELMGAEDLEPIILDQAKAEIRDQYLSASKAHERLQWHPRYGLDEGLRLTVEWYSGFFASQSGLVESVRAV
jgi:CDP-glucose 4,6-dehydratase